MLTNENGPITFILGEETLPKIEGSENYAESLFKEQYDKSFTWVAAYLEKVDKAAGDKEKLRDLNNVLAYIGERGSGKTSCMLSVAKMLKEGTPKETLVPEGKNFKVLDYIDPSFFDTKNNILSLIIARLFGEFDRELKKRPTDERKHKLLELFKKVNDNIDLLLDKKKEFSEDSLQRIDDLAVATNLRDNIEELIKNYLAFFDHKDVLVIPVDDVDLHTSEAYRMVEQIRKYFMLPNVIVLFAVKLDQLALVVKKQYVDEFGRLLKLQPNPNAGENVLNIDVVEEMVDRYLGKFIPLSQRIYLPETEGLFYRKLIIKEANKDDVVFDTVREAVPSLIYRKTRYLFYNSTVSTSLIVPRNLRELRHLIYMLYKMDDSPRGSEDWNSVALYNKALFKKYFFESWATANLAPQDHDIVDNLLALTDAAVFNKSVIMALKNRFDLQDYKEPSEYYYILQDTNIVYNISLGDVMAVLRLIERTAYRQDDIRLLFMIRSIYSIKLYEYYHKRLTDRGAKRVQNSTEIVKQGLLPGISNYEKLVGGNFINSGLTRILPPEITKVARTPRAINTDILVRLLENDENIPYVEFFALTISRPFDSQYNISSPYRRHSERGKPYYKDNINKRGVFEITSIFFNLLDIESSYNRISPELYAKAKANPRSVLRRLVHDVDNVQDVEKMMQGCAIRNIEVLDVLIYELEAVNDRDGKSQEILVECFNRIGRYTIKTYDRPGGAVRLSFAEEIATVLQDMPQETFERIYDPPKLDLSNAKFDVTLLMKGLFKGKDNRGITMLRRIDALYPDVGKTYVREMNRLLGGGKYSYEDMESRLWELNGIVKGE